MKTSRHTQQAAHETPSGEFPHGSPRQRPTNPPGPDRGTDGESDTRLSGPGSSYEPRP